MHDSEYQLSDTEHACGKEDSDIEREVNTITMVYLLDDLPHA